MADRLIFGDKEAAFLQELVRQGVDFMIVGLSAAALQGAPVVTQDIDLWFSDLTDPGIDKALKQVNGSYIQPAGMHPPVFAGDNLSLFDIVVHMHGLGSFDEEKQHTIKAPLGRFKIAVLKLERIIASKQTLGRDKDKLVLKVLQDALTVIQERERRRDCFSHGVTKARRRY